MQLQFRLEVRNIQQFSGALHRSVLRRSSRGSITNRNTLLSGGGLQRFLPLCFSYSFFSWFTACSRFRFTPSAELHQLFQPAGISCTHNHNHSPYAPSDSWFKPLTCTRVYSGAGGHLHRRINLTKAVQLNLLEAELFRTHLSAELASQTFISGFANWDPADSPR